MTVRIEDAGPRDAPALARILSDWFDATPWMPRLHACDEDRVFVGGLIASGTRLARSDDGAASGFLTCDGSEISALYIASDARRQGVGRALVADAKFACRRLTLWTFEANTAARAFYARRGFRETMRSAGENDEGLPDIRLEWGTADD